MFRPRQRSEKSSRTSAPRGSVGSARVWDERTRALHASGALGADRQVPEEPASTAFPALPAGELAALVAGIVQVTLDTRLAQHDPSRRAELARELQARLLALFGAPLPGALEVAEPPTSSAPTEAPPADPVADESPPAFVFLGSASPRERALGLLLEDRLQRLGGTLAARADLRQRLILLALERLARPSEGPTPSGDELQSLDLLQRRAAKLERSLQEARAALAYVSGLEHVDQGLASIYRTVQGLSLEDPQRERKRGALEHLFRANLALQKPAADRA